MSEKEDGSLSDAFAADEPPAFVPGALHDEHVERFGPVTWNLVTFAVWRDRVLRDSDLSQVTGTTVVERRVGRERRSAFPC